MKSELPRDLARQLNDVLKGIPWEVKPGTKHCKIFVNNRLVGISPDHKAKDAGRHGKNLMAQVKRAAESYRKKMG